MRCKYLEGDWYEGVEIQVFCIHPTVVKNHICPFGDEVECDLNAHLWNSQKQKIVTNSRGE